jgi:HD-GYP domain-containing protein (c-di-GMP phosphodiesterase class II)
MIDKHKGLQKSSLTQSHPSTSNDTPLQLNEKDIQQLNQIGLALSAETNPQELIKLVVKRARQILAGDAAALYLTDATRSTKEVLRFRHANYDTSELNLFEATLDISPNSLVGYVGQTKKVLRLDSVEQSANYPFVIKQNSESAQLYPYQSVVAAPLLNSKKELVGVLVVWNKKKFRKVPVTIENFEELVVPFTSTGASILESVASQASIRLENTKLYKDINDLFDGFIRASITAIEARDPSTFGHSERVARLTTALSQEVHLLEHGPYKNHFFSDTQLKEIEYAALLHDFGKIGVRESVLTKARKLFDYEVTQIRDRIDLWKQSKLIEFQQKKIDHILREGHLDEELFRHFEKEYKRRFKEADQAYALLLEYNEPSKISADELEKLEILTELDFQRPNRKQDKVLSGDHFFKMSIRHGSLSDEERKAIEAHVTYTYHFLNQIPWIDDLAQVPTIAYAHHEKPDGSGYPRGIKDKEIPFAAKIMSVADVFDALVAQDRPYKKAISVKEALNILVEEGANNKLDAELINIFIQKHIYRSLTSVK